MNIGDQSLSDAVQERTKRGETFFAEYSLYRRADDFGATCDVERGTPLDLRAYDRLAGVVEIGGTQRAILFDEAVFIQKGGLGTPAKVRIKLNRRAVEACFAEGAEPYFDFQVNAVRPGDEVTVLCGTVQVTDTAAGGIFG